MNAGLIPHGDPAGQLFGDLPAKTKGMSGEAIFKQRCLLIDLKFFYILVLNKSNEPGNFICTLT
jgi:hypothetical protein